jgi:hypothetical protein
MAAEVFLGEHATLAQCSASFDVVLVSPPRAAPTSSKPFLRNHALAFKSPLALEQPASTWTQAALAL